MPVKTSKPAVPVTTRVIQDLRDKSEAGVEKYGVPLHTFNGRNAIKDAYQEALDLAQYLKQALMEQDIEEGRDSLWLTDIDLALGDQHYGDMIRIRDLESAMRRQSEDHASEMNRLQSKLNRQELARISLENELQQEKDSSRGLQLIINKQRIENEHLEEDLKALGRTYSALLSEPKAT